MSRWSRRQAPVRLTCVVANRYDADEKGKHDMKKNEMSNELDYPAISRIFLFSLPYRCRPPICPPPPPPLREARPDLLDHDGPQFRSLTLPVISAPSVSAGRIRVLDNGNSVTSGVPRVRMHGSRQGCPPGERKDTSAS